MSISTPVRPTPTPVGPVSDAATAQQVPKPVPFGPTFLAAAAIVAGSTALSVPISGTSWVLPLVEVVAVIWLVGVGGRLIRLPAVVTALLQLAGFAVALTSLFTSSGIGGVLPGKDALAEAGALMSGAWAQIVGTAAPAPATPELSFLIALAVGCAAFIADFLVAEAHSPALVALPLLCLYSVPASIANEMLPWYSFVLPAVLYALLLAVTGHRDRRTGTRAWLGLAVNGLSITALATAAALLVAGTTTQVGTTGRLPHTNGNGTGTIGLSPLASLRGNLQQSTPVNVLTASGLRTPDYFRTVALTKWTSNQGFSVGALQADLSDVNGPLNGTPSLTDDTRITVTTQGYQDRFLPILTGTTSVNGLDASWDFDAALNTVYRPDKVKPGRYVIDVNAKKPTSTQLRADTAVPGGELTETGSLGKSVRDKAEEVTAAAATAFDKANALEKWFTTPANGFVYSLEVPSGNSGDALVDFLNGKQGFCEQYASAMAIMLRSLNIPTRVVVGFTQGVKGADGSYLITSHDAHAWVEVKFEQSGWVRFDPTPPVGGQGGQQGFTEPRAKPRPSTAATTATGTTGTKVPNVPETSTRVTTARTVVTQVDVAAGADSSSSGWVRLVLLALLALIVLAGLLLLPTALRLRRRRSRLQLARSGGPGSASAAWTEIEDTAVDHGILPHSAESARVTANRLARRAHLGESDRAQLRAVVLAAEQEWYGVGAGGADAGGADAGGAGAVGADAGGSHERVNGTFGGTLTLERTSTPGRPVDLAAGVASVVIGLKENAKVPLTERILPRSMRPRFGG